ncbi:MAG: bifunctional diaminohydroxyphosphoribosylaminopyrimidine deaminase/5-amino-6-(5-phosphoribosylamino)uracil reductase RibD [Pirellulales bacterium]
MSPVEADARFMSRALEIAARGEGFVEPNPMVGCVIVRDGRVVGEGGHERFGGPHAEANALQAAGDARGATLYVTLEPCCHTGKTPPCTDAIIAAGLARVVAAVRDPFPKVDGGGLAALRAAGIACDVGLMEHEARELLAPYLKLVTTGRPWVIAKWAMTLDGKLATRTGSSQWISGEAARKKVHQLRGRVDAIVVGSGTARVDNPLLTARPPGPRAALRVVVDSSASLRIDSQLVRTARSTPVLVAASRHAEHSNRNVLEQAGVEVLTLAGESHAERVTGLLAELGRRQCTNVLVEGGSRLLGSLFDLGAIDEVHAFIAPKLVGGELAPSPLAGAGLATMNDAIQLQNCVVETVGEDVYVRGRVH